MKAKRTHRTEGIVAGVLFITATAATMASQMIVAPILDAPDITSQIAEQRTAFTLGVILEFTNALASAGIAFALYPIIRRCAEGLAVAYLGLRILEASIGLFAASTLLALLSPIDPAVGLALHSWGFLLVLIVFRRAFRHRKRLISSATSGPSSFFSPPYQGLPPQPAAPLPTSQVSRNWPLFSGRSCVKLLRWAVLLVSLYRMISRQRHGSGCKRFHLACGPPQQSMLNMVGR